MLSRVCAGARACPFVAGARYTRARPDAAARVMLRRLASRLWTSATAAVTRASGAPVSAAQALRLQLAGQPVVAFPADASELDSTSVHEWGINVVYTPLNFPSSGVLRRPACGGDAAAVAADAAAFLWGAPPAAAAQRFGGWPCWRSRGGRGGLRGGKQESCGGRGRRRGRGGRGGLREEGRAGLRGGRGGIRGRDGHR
jgi:hypothetical protein